MALRRIIIIFAPPFGCALLDRNQKSLKNKKSHALSKLRLLRIERRSRGLDGLDAGLQIGGVAVVTGPQISNPRKGSLLTVRADYRAAVHLSLGVQAAECSVDQCVIGKALGLLEQHGAQHNEVKCSDRFPDLF